MRIEGEPVDPADYTAEEKSAVDEFLELLRLFLSGDMTDEELRAFLDYLRAALDDPTLAPLLEAAGIDAELLDGLEAGLDSDADFDPMEWMALFDKLDALGGSNEFGYLDVVRMDFADYALERLAIAQGEANNEQARIDYANLALALFEELIETGVATTLPPELIELLLNAGFTSEDTSNENLKKILDADDPYAEAQIHIFTTDELSEIQGEVGTYAENKSDGLTTDILLNMQALIAFRDELAKFASAMIKANHDGSMTMINNIGSI